MLEDLLPLLIPVLYGLYRKGFSNKTYNEELKEELEKKENRKIDALEKRETITSEEERPVDEKPGIFANLLRDKKEE